MKMTEQKKVKEIEVCHTIQYLNITFEDGSEIFTPRTWIFRLKEHYYAHVMKKPKKSKSYRRWIIKEFERKIPKILMNSEYHFKRFFYKKLARLELMLAKLYRNNLI